jgi:hypothetical protein
MRYLVLSLFVLAAAAQQTPRSQTDVYTYDVNGRRTLDVQQDSGAGGSEQALRTMNGRVAPLEKVEEKVLSDNGTERVVEKLIRPFDANGTPQPPQRVRITERKEPDGAKSTETQVFQGNMNGGFLLSERSQTTERTSNGRTVVETQVARPTINGGLDTVEKRSSTIVKAGEKVSEDTLTYRLDANGSFYPAVRAVKETEKKDGRTVENASTYVKGDRSEMVLTGQTLTETTTRDDGSETKQVNVFGLNAPGRPSTGQAALREQRIIERSKTNGGVVEAMSIRRPAVDDPKVLGPAQKISERVCTGPCQ